MRKNHTRIPVGYFLMAGVVAVLAKILLLQNHYSHHRFDIISSSSTMKEDGRKVVGNKVTAKATTVRNLQWCKSRYGSEYKSKVIVGTITKVEYVRKKDIGPAQSYITASFDFGDNDIKSMKIHLSQLKVFVEGERLKDPPNASITAHAAAVVDVNIHASNEAPPIDNGNNDMLEGVSDKPSATAAAAGTDAVARAPTVEEIDAAAKALESPPTNSTNLFDVNNNVASPPRHQRLFREVIDSPAKSSDPVAEAGGMKWYDMPYHSLKPLNGNIPYREWGLKLPTGEIWRDGCNSERTITRLDVFLQLFPPLALKTLLFATNNQLKKTIVLNKQLDKNY